MILSIIIPVYNIEKYISYCLDSCLNQTFNGEYEIICINDGSTDNSLQVLRDYESKNSCIRVIDKPNGGVSSARNIGIREAKGDYIWFVDGDDWINSKSIEIIVKEINRYDYILDAVLFNYVATKKKEEFTIDDNYEKRLFKIGYATLKSKYASTVCCRWFKSSILKENNIFFDESMKYSEDTLFIFSFNYCKPKTLALDVPLYYYYKREGSAMNKLSVSQHCICMYKLAEIYRKIELTTDEHQFMLRMRNAYIQAMQAFCADLCMYCSDKSIVKNVISELERLNLYPYGCDREVFRVNPKRSLKNNVINWIFGLLSYKVYFLFCWHICCIPFYNHRHSTSKEEQLKILNFLKEKK